MSGVFRRAASSAQYCRGFAGVVLLAIAWLNPREISYLGFNLMLNLAIPIALATISQMFVVAVEAIKPSIGYFPLSSGAWPRHG